MVPLFAVALTFALNNKLPVGLDLWPFGMIVEMPIYLAMFGATLVGIIIGGTVAWVGQGRVRGNLRDQAYQGEVARRELKTEREKLAELERELKALKTPTSQTALAPIQETLPPKSSES
jgi:uncharacterized integral membrane protein